MNNNYSRPKPEEYYEIERHEIIDEITIGNHNVLDIGCAKGKTAEIIRSKGKAKHVVGVELNAAIGEKAERLFDVLIIGDIEKVEVPTPFGHYDYILAGDVLEHLVDPWNVLLKMRDALKSDGKIIFSVPNIRNWTVWLPLVLLGRWEYTEYGILDSTHLRFFTKRTCIDMVKNSDMRIISIRPAGSRVSRIFNRLGMSFFEQITAMQFIVVCQRIA